MHAYIQYTLAKKEKGKTIFKLEPHKVTHDCNGSTQEAEVEGLP